MASVVRWGRGGRAAARRPAKAAAAGFEVAAPRGRNWEEALVEMREAKRRAFIVATVLVACLCHSYTAIPLPDELKKMRRI